MTETVERPRKPTEREKIVSWRLYVLTRDDLVPVTVAEQVADHTEIPYDRYLDLVRNGCDPSCAFEILRGD